MAKKKPATPAPAFTLPPLQSDADCIAEIAKIAHVARRLDARKARLESAAQELALQAASDLMAMQAEHDARINALRAYCEKHRARLTDDGKTKTVKFATGNVAWRFLPASVTIKGIKVDDLIALIKKNGQAALLFLRQKTEIDKEGMARHPDLAQTFKGVKIKSAGEEFYVEPLDAEIDAAVQP